MVVVGRLDCTQRSAAGFAALGQRQYLHFRDFRNSRSPALRHLWRHSARAVRCSVHLAVPGLVQATPLAANCLQLGRVSPVDLAGRVDLPNRPALQNRAGLRGPVHRPSNNLQHRSTLFSNTWMVAFAVAIQQGVRPTVAIWWSHFQEVLVNYAAGGSIAALLVYNTREVQTGVCIRDPSTSGLAVPHLPVVQPACRS